MRFSIYLTATSPLPWTDSSFVGLSLVTYTALELHYSLAAPSCARESLAASGSYFRVWGMLARVRTGRGGAFRALRTRQRTEVFAAHDHVAIGPHAGSDSEAEMRVATYARVSTANNGASSSLLSPSSSTPARRSWPQIAKQLGVGVGTAYRAHQELSKNPAGKNLSRIPDSAEAVAD